MLDAPSANAASRPLATPCPPRRRLVLWLALVLASTWLLVSGCAPNTLHAAIAAGNEKRALKLIEKGKGLEDRDAHGATPLHSAVCADQAPVIRALLDAGADVNARAQNGITAICYVGWRDNPEVLAMLVEAGGDVNATVDNGLTALSFMFLNVDDEEDYQRSALVADELIAAGAAPDAGAHSSTSEIYVWALYYLAGRAAGAGAASAGDSFETARGLFDHHAALQRVRHEELTERAKGVTGRNIGKGLGSFFVGVATGVATLGLVSVVPNPDYESKRAILTEAEKARQRAELYEKTSLECQRQLDSLARSTSGDGPGPAA